MRLPQPIANTVRWGALFALVVGCRLLLIDHYASDVPILDQWDAEGAFLLKPFVEGSLHLGDLFAAHNEHRIVLTRLWTLLWYWLNGQWDPRLEIVANAFLFGFISVLVAVALARIFGGRKYAAIIIAVTLWAGLPYAQENTLWGFQSCFYFLIGLSLAAIWCLASDRNRVCYWIGAVAALAACFTMASGFLCGVAVLVVQLLRFYRQRLDARQLVAASALPLAIVAIGLATRATVPHHAAFVAPSVGLWFAHFARCMAWPFCDWPVMALLMYLPVVALTLRYAQRSRQLTIEYATGCELLIAVASWVVLQAAAISYGRAGYDVRVMSRYMDLLAIGAMVNFFALLALGAQASTTRLRVATAAWAVVVIVGATLTSYAQLFPQRGRRTYMQNAINVARAYLATHDKPLLHTSEPLPIPYPDADRIANLLDDVSIQRMLPVSLRPALVLEPAHETTAFVPGGIPPDIVNASRERVWGSYSAAGAQSTGTLQTRPVFSHLTYLEFEIAGYLRKGLSLHVRDTAGGKDHRVIPTARIDPQWRAAYLSLGKGWQKVIAEDRRSDDWFALREPREMGLFSYAAIKTMPSGPVFLAVGLLLVCIMIAEHLQERRDNSA